MDPYEEELDLTRDDVAACFDVPPPLLLRPDGAAGTYGNADIDLAEVAVAFQRRWDELVDTVRRLYSSIVVAAGGEEQLRQILLAVEIEREAWECEHPDIPFDTHCECLCPMNGHDGATCEQTAVTYDIRSYRGSPVAIPMCSPCSEALAEWRDLRAGLAAL